jgi:dTMP kinase
MSKGRYICFEGGDLTGKTTMAHEVKGWLLSQGIVSKVAPQPGSTQLGEHLRHIVKHEKRILIGNETEALIFVLDHMAFVENILREALDEGIWILSDRNNYVSALVYQTLNGVDPDRLDEFYSIIPTPKLDVIFLLDAPLDALASRAEQRNDGKWDRYESNPGFMKKVYDSYVKLDKDHLARLSKIADSVCRIDAEGDQSTVFGRIKDHLTGLL